MNINFTKMQGLGNDFVIIDALNTPFTLDSEQIQRMANRRFGIGFDQLLLLEPATDTKADFIYRIFNADGGEVAQCGNGARCLAKYIRANHLKTKDPITLHTANGLLELSFTNENQVKVLIPAAKLSPKDIPMATKQTGPAYHLSYQDKEIEFFVANVGNPHAIIKVSKGLDPKTVGNWLCTHDIFPEGANINFVKVISPSHIELTVYERGSGLTLACGSGACAAVAVGSSQGWLDKSVKVSQKGGDLTINWSENSAPIEMIGPGEFVYTGKWIN